VGEEPDEGVDQRRYVNVIVFCHQESIVVRQHGDRKVEPPRSNAKQVNAACSSPSTGGLCFSGHEHLFEHGWNIITMPVDGIGWT